MAKMLDRARTYLVSEGVTFTVNGEDPAGLDADVARRRPSSVCTSRRTATCGSASG